MRLLPCARLVRQKLRQKHQLFQRLQPSLHQHLFLLL
jgi:hypothetical protein